MGACYSRQSNVAAPGRVDTSSMPQPVQSNHSTDGVNSFGYKPPQGGRGRGQARNSNQKSFKPEARAPLSVLSTAAATGQPAADAPKPAGQPKANRFGFRSGNKKKGARKPISSAGNSSESNASSRSSLNNNRQGSGISSGERSPVTAYNPEKGGKWLMIDDESQMGSLPKHGHGRAVAFLVTEKVDTSIKQQKTPSVEDLENGNLKSTNKSSPPMFKGKKTHSDGNKRYYVKQAATQNSKSTGKESPKQIKQIPKNNKGKNNLGKNPKKYGSVDGSRENRSPNSSQESKTKFQGVRNKVVDIGKKMMGSSRDRSDSDAVDSNIIENQSVQECQKLLHAPIAVIDSLETTSVGSLFSEDLLLESELNVNNDTNKTVGSTSSPRKTSASSSQGCTNSRENLEVKSATARLDKLPPPGRRYADGGSFKRRPSSLKKIDSEETEEPRNESLVELAVLLQKNQPVKKRLPRRQRARRPSSFPGPKLSTENMVSPSMDDVSPMDGPKSAPAVRTLKPPRQTPNIGDEEQVVLDGFTYRQLMQDVTHFKTMLLKLKRFMQEDDIGTPLGASFKAVLLQQNGIKYGGSTPSSPGAVAGSPNPFFMEKDPENTPSVPELLQENNDLRQEMKAMQLQMEQQEKTVKLLQRQMTKYECGYSGTNGKSYSNASTQTDQPRLPVVTKSDVTRKVTSSQIGYRSRPELSSKENGDTKEQSSIIEANEVSSTVDHGLNSTYTFEDSSVMNVASSDTTGYCSVMNVASSDTTGYCSDLTVPTDTKPLDSCYQEQNARILDTSESGSCVDRGTANSNSEQFLAEPDIFHVSSLKKTAEQIVADKCVVNSYPLPSGRSDQGYTAINTQSHCQAISRIKNSVPEKAAKRNAQSSFLSKFGFPAKTVHHQQRRGFPSSEASPVDNVAMKATIPEVKDGNSVAEEEDFHQSAGSDGERTLSDSSSVSNCMSTDDIENTSRMIASPPSLTMKRSHLQQPGTLRYSRSLTSVTSVTDPAIPQFSIQKTRRLPVQLKSFASVCNK